MSCIPLTFPLEFTQQYTFKPSTDILDVVVNDDGMLAVTAANVDYVFVNQYNANDTTQRLLLSLHGTYVHIIIACPNAGCTHPPQIYSITPLIIHELTCAIRAVSIHREYIVCDAMHQDNMYKFYLMSDHIKYAALCSRLFATKSTIQYVIINDKNVIVDL